MLSWPVLASGTIPPLRRNELRLYWRPKALGTKNARADRETWLRQMLAPLLACRAEALSLDYEARGRPFVRHPHAPDFNLSDTGDGSLLAICRQGRVGVDVERLDRLPRMGLRLAQRWFAAEEAVALTGLPPASAARAFLYLWTAKEAACKATGTGISGYLAQWRFEIGEAPRLRALPKDAGSAERWRFLRIAPSPAHTAVIALRDAPAELWVNAYTVGD